MALKSHRSQLILSHLLPLVILMPVLGVLLVYIVETQIILANLSADLAREAAVLAEIASQQQSVFDDPAQAEFFARVAGAQYERNVALYQEDGSTWAIIAEPNARAAIEPTNAEIAALSAGQAQTRTTTHVNPAQADVQVLVPVRDASSRLVGIIRVSEHIDRLNVRLTQMRLLILGATLVGLLVALAISFYFATRTSQRLEAVTTAIGNVARGDMVPQNHPPMPREFRGTLDAVNDLQQRLRESQETRQRLLANLVHELGRPLGALQAAIHALEQGADRDPVLRDELLQGMDAQVERLKPLLDNLASLHGGLSGALELHRVPVDLNEWLPTILVTWRQAAEQANLKWTQEIPSDLPTLSLDADRMAQALGNLLSNAIKYTRADGGSIAVRAGDASNQVWIAVEDTGIGISDEDLAHIFDPFYRGHTARFPQGMGLGLAIARDVVNAHNGRIAVASAANQGSRFTVYLPR